MGERRLLDRILEPGSLSVRFQPVLTAHFRRPVPHYFEALIRGPQGTTVENPAILFEYARKKSQEATVDRACVATILDAAAGLPTGAVVGLNVHASTLAMDEGFVGFLAQALTARGFACERLIVEIVEHAPPWNVLAFRVALDGLRRLGVRIALDDVGLGHSNFMMILECRPDYFKVDRYFVHGCHQDFHRRAVLASVAQLALAFDALVVAEGVEERTDLVAVRQMGISLVQGHLFGQPAPAAEVRQAFASPPKKRTSARSAVARK